MGAGRLVPGDDEVAAREIADRDETGRGEDESRGKEAVGGTGAGALAESGQEVLEPGTDLIAEAPDTGGDPAEGGPPSGCGTGEQGCGEFAEDLATLGEERATGARERDGAEIKTELAAGTM